MLPPLKMIASVNIAFETQFKKYFIEKSCFVFEIFNFWTTDSARGSCQFRSVCPSLCLYVTLLSQYSFASLIFCMKLGFSKH